MKVSLRWATAVALAWGACSFAPDAVHAQRRSTPRGGILVDAAAMVASQQPTEATAGDLQPQAAPFVEEPPASPSDVEGLTEPPLRPDIAERSAETIREEALAEIPSVSQTASPFLQFGQFNFGYSWQYADTDHIYDGTERQFAAEAAAQVRAINGTHTATFEMGLCERTTLVYELPFQYNSRRQQAGPISGGRINGYFVTDTGDVADSRVYLRKWLYDEGEYVPFFNRPGNVSLAAGVKLPTGRDDKSTFFNGGDGGRDYFHDFSVQTGTGSTDIVLAGAMYLDMGKFVPYAGFNWLITPADNTGVLAFHPQIADPNTTVVNSVPDAITWTVGFRYDLGRAIAEHWFGGGSCCGSCNDCVDCAGCGELPRRQAWSPCCEDRCGPARDAMWTIDRLRASFAVQGSHTPENDIFGHSTGFRRAFDAIFLEPGISYDLGSNCTIFASVPLAVYRDLYTNAGTFPDTQFNFGMSFNVR
ncbi:MAG: hypothetical protein DCC68_07295 [Planctomycetota bacterium]|nr:MAG: hypothetical protein DCC68_07295 [Planctomycetota bacterium]